MWERPSAFEWALSGTNGEDTLAWVKSGAILASLESIFGPLECHGCIKLCQVQLQGDSDPLLEEES